VRCLYHPNSRHPAGRSVRSARSGRNPPPTSNLLFKGGDACLQRRNTLLLLIRGLQIDCHHVHLGYDLPVEVLPTGVSLLDLYSRYSENGI